MLAAKEGHGLMEREGEREREAGLTKGVGSGGAAVARPTAPPAGGNHSHRRAAGWPVRGFPSYSCHSSPWKGEGAAGSRGERKEGRGYSCMTSACKGGGGEKVTCAGFSSQGRATVRPFSVKWLWGKPTT